MNNAVPIDRTTSRAVDANGFDESAFGAMLGFNDALELACAGIFHSGDLSGLRTIGSVSTPGIEKPEKNDAISANLVNALEMRTAIVLNCDKSVMTEPGGLKIPRARGGGGLNLHSPSHARELPGLRDVADVGNHR
jgi:hypothetical protein